MIFVRFGFAAIYLLSIIYCRSTNDESVSLESFLPDIDVCRHYKSEVLCKNFTLATQCNAIEYCEQNVWFLPDYSLCSMCQNSITFEGRSVAIQTDVIARFLLECEMKTSIEIFQKKCRNAVEKYMNPRSDEILAEIFKGSDAETICTRIGLCDDSSQLATSTSILSLSAQGADIDQDISLYFPSRDFHVNAKFQPGDVLLLGTKKCSWSPSYTCSNLTTSNECGSTSHCINHVWSKQTYDEDNDSVCQVCKGMVQQARDELLRNGTQEELKEVFEGSCKLILIKEIQKECIKLTYGFVSELTEMLASEMNPTAVCTVTGLCNCPRVDDLLAAESKFEADVCVNCTVAFNFMSHFFTRNSKNVILSRITRVCDDFSSYSDLCVFFMNTNFDDFYELVTLKKQPPVACHITGMCTFQYHWHDTLPQIDFQRQVETMMLQQDDTLECDLCKQLAEHVRQVLVTNTTEEEFLQMLHGLCEQFGKFMDTCLQLADENVKIIYKYLTVKFNAAQICTILYVCPRQRDIVTDQTMNLITGRDPFVPLESTLNTFPINLITSRDHFILSESTLNTSPNGCTICKIVMQQIEKQLDNKREIEDVVNKVCLLVPSKDKFYCQNFINEYAPSLIKSLTDGTDPKVICNMLDACSTKVENQLCPFCQCLLKNVQKILQNPKNRNDLDNLVQIVCYLAPSKTKSKCEKFVSEYSNRLLEILATDVDPDEICPAIKVCPTFQDEKERCRRCQVLMNNLIHRLNGNSGEDNVEKTLSSISIKEARSEVGIELKLNFQHEVRRSMIARLNAEDSCYLMKFCEMDASQIESNKTPDTVLSNADTDPPVCVFCKWLVHGFEKDPSNRSEAEMAGLKLIMYSLCYYTLNNTLPQKGCAEKVDNQMPDIVKRNISPSEICAAVKLCVSNSIIDTEEQKHLEKIINSLVNRPLRNWKYYEAPSQASHLKDDDPVESSDV